MNAKEREAHALQAIKEAGIGLRLIRTTFEAEKMLALVRSAGEYGPGGLALTLIMAANFAVYQAVVAAEAHGEDPAEVAKQLRIVADHNMATTDRMLSDKGLPEVFAPEGAAASAAPVQEAQEVAS